MFGSQRPRVWGINGGRGAGVERTWNDTTNFSTEARRTFMTPPGPLHIFIRPLEVTCHDSGRLDFVVCLDTLLFPSALLLLLRHDPPGQVIDSTTRPPAG